MRQVRQVCKYAHTQRTRRFVLSDYVYWAFVEINSVDMTGVTFDYRICWRKWNDAGLARTVIWCLAAFIMFDASASDDDLDQSEKIVADIGTCRDRLAAGRRHKGRSVSDEWRKRQSKTTIGSATRTSKNA